MRGRILLVALLVLLLVLLATCAALATTTTRAPTNVDIIRGSPPTIVATTISPYTRAEGTSFVADLTRGSPGTSTAAIVGIETFSPESNGLTITSGTPGGTARAAPTTTVNGIQRAGDYRARGTPTIAAAPLLDKWTIYSTGFEHAYAYHPATPATSDYAPGARQMTINDPITSAVAAIT